MRKNIRIWLWSIAAIITLAALGYYFANKIFVPENFTEARIKSSEIAKEIVSLIGQSVKNLEIINFQDRHNNLKTALQLVQKELEESKKFRDKALELNTELGLMTIATTAITPTKARNLALESISHELNLVSRLVNYNALLNALLQTLEFKFSKSIGSDADDVQKLIKNMNEEAKEINKLNNLFNQKMEEFDKLTSSD